MSMPAQDFHQRGFAGAVAADQANAVVAGNQPVDVFEEEFVAETFSGAGKLDHGLHLSSHKTSGVLNVVSRETEKEVVKQDCRIGEIPRQMMQFLWPNCSGDGVLGGAAIPRGGIRSPQLTVELDSFQRAVDHDPRARGNISLHVPWPGAVSLLRD